MDSYKYDAVENYLKQNIPELCSAIKYNYHNEILISINLIITQNFFKCVNLREVAAKLTGRVLQVQDSIN